MAHLARRRVAASVLAVLAIGASACGGSSSSGPSGGSSASLTSTTASDTADTDTDADTTTTTPAATPTSTAPGPSKAPDALVVAKLAANADLATAIGGAISPVEDDGGQDLNGSGFASTARLNTPDTKLTLRLWTYTDLDSAKQSFQQYADADPAQAITGVGEEAAVRRSGTGVVVRTGAQVLTVDAEISDATNKALETAKENGTSVDQAVLDAADAALLNDSTAAATALASRLDGQPVTGSPLTYLPAGALDPCPGGAGTSSTDSIAVEQLAMESDRPPALQCFYRFSSPSSGAPTGILLVYTLTSDQTAAAITPTTPNDVFLTKVDGFDQLGGAMAISTASNASVAVATQGQLDFLIVIDDSSAAGFTRHSTRVGSAPPQLLIWVSQGDSTELSDTKSCVDNLSYTLDTLLAEQKDAFGPDVVAPSIAELAAPIQTACSR